MKQYRVYEDIRYLILETDDKDEALKTWRQAHRDNPSKTRTH